MKVTIKLKPRGRGIYVDNKGDLYLGYPKRKVAYMALKEQQKLIYLYANRFVFPIVVGVLILLVSTWYYGLLSSLILFIAIEISYKKLFIPSLIEYKNVEFLDIENLRSDLNNIQNTTLTNKVINVFLLLLLMSFMSINAYFTISNSSDYSEFNSVALIIATFIVDTVCIYYIASYIRAIFIQNKVEKVKK